MNTHKCPQRECTILVPDSRFCCLFHWHALGTATQHAIWDTVHLPLLAPARRAAINAARREWGDVWVGRAAVRNVDF